MAHGGGSTTRGAPSRTKRCRRRLPASARASLPLPAAPERQRWAAARSFGSWRGPEHTLTRHDHPRSHAPWPCGHRRHASPGSASSKPLCCGRAATRTDRWSRARGRRQRGHPQAWGASGVARSRLQRGRWRERARAGAPTLACGWRRGTVTGASVQRGRVAPRPAPCAGRWVWSGVGARSGGRLARSDSRQRQASHGASRCREVVQGSGVPHALHPGAWCRVSGYRPRSLGHCGSRCPGRCPRGWRWSVPGTPGRPRRSPAPQQRHAGDGGQRPLVPRSRCPPRLMPSVRCARWGASRPR